MNNPLVSIIIPVYNTKQYLKSSIESCLNQSYNNIEIVLIDDGSSDGSGKICDEYGKKFPKKNVKFQKYISVYHKSNGGLYSVFSFGSKVASGDLITFVDSDDLVSTDYITKLQNARVSTNSQIAFCSMDYFDKSHTFTSNTSNFGDFNINTISSYEDLLSHFVDRPKQYRLFFDLQRQLSPKIYYNDITEDKIALLIVCDNVKVKKNQLLYGTNAAAVVNETLYHYRQRSSSMEHSSLLININNYIKISIDRFNQIQNTINFLYPSCSKNNCIIKYREIMQDSLVLYVLWRLVSFVNAGCSISDLKKLRKTLYCSLEKKKTSMSFIFKFLNILSKMGSVPLFFCCKIAKKVSRFKPSVAQSSKEDLFE